MSIFDIFKKKQEKKDTVSEETKAVNPTSSASATENDEIPTLSAATEASVRIPVLSATTGASVEASTIEKEKIAEPPVEERLHQAHTEMVFYQLSHEYNKVIKMQVKQNYETGKVEEFQLCKIIHSDDYAKLFETYPEEMAHFEELYLPIYDAEMGKLHNNSEFIFDDITEFADFVQKINYYQGTMISDRYFNVVNDALSFYGIERHGDKLFGIAKFFSFEYEDFIKIKDVITEEIEILMNKSANDDQKIFAVNRIKNKTGRYMKIKEGKYIV